MDLFEPQLSIFGTTDIGVARRRGSPASPDPALLARIADPLTLNAQQLAVVTAPPQPTLVIAGAGSGKTNVLVRRAAWLIAHGIRPEDMLLITFTRKAAGEMLSRVQEFLPRPDAKIHGGTFHSMAHSWLRTYGSAIKLSPTFTIMDESDAAGLVHLLASKLGLAGGKGFPDKRTVLALMGHAANSLLPITQTIDVHFPELVPYQQQLLSLHRLFVETKWTQQRFDYDDLLLLVHQLLMEEPAAAHTLSHQYRAILVDEYQDGTRLQAELVRALGGPHHNVMVVGDDSQSIYAFRSANVRNMLDFPTLFPGTVTHTLEQNYRSSEPILQLANAILAEAQHVYPKRLFSTRQQGRRPLLVQCPDESAQSNYVVQQIQALLTQGVALHRIAVLVRLSSHSYDLETVLGRHHIPFTKYGGLALTEMAHVKDLRAYVQIAEHPADPESWHRVLLLLDRIGPKTAQQLITAMRAHTQPLDVLRTDTSAAQRALQDLAEVITLLRNESLPVSVRLHRLLEHYDRILTRHYPTDAAQRRAELAHLCGAGTEHASMQDFLDALGGHVRPSCSTPHPDHTLVLSTVHSAKGLEWDAVFVLQLLDTRFPYIRSCRDPESLEEERRLLYVAVTRPRHVLILTYPVRVYEVYSGTATRTCSRFLAHIPATILDRLTLEVTA